MRLRAVASGYPLLRTVLQMSFSLDRPKATGKSHGRQSYTCAILPLLPLCLPYSRRRLRECARGPASTIRFAWVVRETPRHRMAGLNRVSPRFHIGLRLTGSHIARKTGARIGFSSGRARCSWMTMPLSRRCTMRSASDIARAAAAGGMVDRWSRVLRARYV
jgi:hypothetical protein